MAQRRFVPLGSRHLLRKDATPMAGKSITPDPRTPQKGPVVSIKAKASPPQAVHPAVKPTQAKPATTKPAIAAPLPKSAKRGAVPVIADRPARREWVAMCLALA